jgi:hypothetical protein
MYYVVKTGEHFFFDESRGLKKLGQERRISLRSEMRAQERTFRAREVTSQRIIKIRPPKRDSR